MLDRITYNPDYISVFEGVTFENMDDKEYYQARDKISAFFKYNIFHPDDNDSFLELPYHQENFNYFRNENDLYDESCNDLEDLDLEELKCLNSLKGEANEKI